MAVLDEYQRVNPGGVEPVRVGDVATGVGLQRGKTYARRSFVPQHEPDESVTEVALAVEEQDRPVDSSADGCRGTQRRPALLLIDRF